MNIMRNIEPIKVQIRKLDKHEHVPSFDCGDEDLNEFILNDSPLYRKELLAVSYVMESSETKQVIAYFSLANDKITITDFPDKNAFNRFRRKRFVNQKRLKSYPAVKICRFAVDKQFQSLSYGRILMNFIKTFILSSSKTTGCRFLTVDAYTDAVPFYKKNDFEPLDIPQDTDRTHLFYYDLKQSISDPIDDNRNITEEIIEVAANLKSLGVSADVISKATYLTVEEIAAL